MAGKKYDYTKMTSELASVDRNVMKQQVSFISNSLTIFSEKV